MKTLGKIKLNQIVKDNLESRQMNVLKGGGYSICVGCMGGCSSTDDDVKVQEIEEMADSESVQE